MSAYDAAIIGAGHNGLVCAAYLARAGWRVVVLEAADAPGGAATTAEFSPGFRVPACAHLLHALHPRIVRDLKLARHGYALAASGLATIALAADGRHLRLAEASAPSAIRARSAADAEAWPRLAARLGRMAKALAPFLAQTAPRLGTDSWRDRMTLGRLGLAIRRLGREEAREFLRIVGMNVADLVEETFEDDLVRGAVACDAVLGARLGPRSPGSVFTLLYRIAHQGGRGVALPKGGMGGLTRALADAASRAEIRTRAPVARIVVENDRAVGVALAGGEVVPARLVVSSADPRTTFLDLLGTAHLDTGFVRRVRNVRMNGVAAKLHLALDGLPAVAGLEAGDLGGRLIVAPGVDAIERAFDASKYGEVSAEPLIEAVIPSLHDSGLAPAGKHVLSAIVQYVPYDLAGDWEALREAAMNRAIDRLEGVLPGLRGHVVAAEMLGPRDLERRFRMAGGHWHHGELALDQAFMLRPVPGAAQYATPVAGLYLCGAGGHPGGGVSGLPGFNAARRILATEERP